MKMSEKHARPKPGYDEKAAQENPRELRKAMPEDGIVGAVAADPLHQLFGVMEELHHIDKTRDEHAELLDAYAFGAGATREKPDFLLLLSERMRETRVHWLARTINRLVESALEEREGLRAQITNLTLQNAQVVADLYNIRMDLQERRAPKPAKQKSGRKKTSAKKRGERLVTSTYPGGAPR